MTLLSKTEYSLLFELCFENLSLSLSLSLSVGVGDFQKILRISLVLKCVEESFRKYTMMGDDCVFCGGNTTY